MPLTRGPVIVVDDDAAVRNSLKFALELEGMDVRLYEDGAQLLSEAELPARGCLVLDYRMPVMTGLELLEALRDRDVSLPAILITAKATEELHGRAARSGFRRILEKPLEDSKLLDSIRSALAAS